MRDEVLGRGGRGRRARVRLFQRSSRHPTSNTGCLGRGTAWRASKDLAASGMIKKGQEAIPVDDDHPHWIVTDIDQFYCRICNPSRLQRKVCALNTHHLRRSLFSSSWFKYLDDGRTTDNAGCAEDAEDNAAESCPASSSAAAAAVGRPARWTANGIMGRPFQASLPRSRGVARPREAVHRGGRAELS